MDKDKSKALLEAYPLLLCSPFTCNIEDLKPEAQTLHSNAAQTY